MNSHPYQNMHERFEPVGKDSPGNGPQMSLNVVIDILCCKNLVFNNLSVTTRLLAEKISFHLYISFSLPQNLNFLMEHYRQIFIPGLIKKTPLVPSYKRSIGIKYKSRVDETLQIFINLR
jgi:hypothetical protein